MDVNAGVELDGSSDQSDWRDPRDDGCAPPLSGFPLQARRDQQSAGRYPEMVYVEPLHKSSWPNFGIATQYATVVGVSGFPRRRAPLKTKRDATDGEFPGSRSYQTPSLHRCGRSRRDQTFTGPLLNNWVWSSLVFGELAWQLMKMLQLAIHVAAQAGRNRT